jgi:SOS response regulatory protein OraA/RecX
MNLHGLLRYVKSELKDRGQPKPAIRLTLQGMGVSKAVITALLNEYDDTGNIRKSITVRSRYFKEKNAKTNKAKT